MSFYLKIDNELVKKSSDSKFAFNMAVSKFSSGRKYFVNGEWVDKPKGKPEKTVICFKNLNDYAKASQLYNLWKIIDSLKIENPVDPEKMFNELAEARKQNKEITLFVPWGVRPDFDESCYKDGKFKDNSPEKEVLEKVFKFQNILLENKVKSKVVLMPADVYATEINNVNPIKAYGYFKVLKNTVSNIDSCEVKPWSEIRKENKEKYSKLCQKYTNEKIQEIIPSGMQEKAFSSARKLSGHQSDEEQKNAAFKYMRERMVEALIVDELYKPIKVSCVDPMKDAKMDVNLTRLYIIDEDLRFPWLKKEKGR